MKKFAHLLEERGVPWDRNDPLQSRVGKYVKALEAEREIREITRRIIKSAISVFDQFNDIRNNRSFAHDNADRKRHTSELQSLMRISYDVFCLQKKKT